jgi:hypothetical protein
MSIKGLQELAREAGLGVMSSTSWIDLNAYEKITGIYAQNPQAYAKPAFEADASCADSHLDQYGEAEEDFALSEDIEKLDVNEISADIETLCTEELLQTVTLDKVLQPDAFVSDPCASHDFNMQENDPEDSINLFPQIDFNNISRSNWVLGKEALEKISSMDLKKLFVLKICRLDSNTAAKIVDSLESQEKKDFLKSLLLEYNEKKKNYLASQALSFIRMKSQEGLDELFLNERDRILANGKSCLISAYASIIQSLKDESEFLMLLDTCLRSVHYFIAEDLLSLYGKKIKGEEENEPALKKIRGLLAGLNDSALIEAFTENLDDGCKYRDELISKLRLLVVNGHELIPVLKILDRIDFQRISRDDIAMIKDFISSETATIDQKQQFLYRVCLRDLHLAARIISCVASQVEWELMRDSMLAYCDEHRSIFIGTRILVFLALRDSSRLEALLCSSVDGMVEGKGVSYLRYVYKNVAEKLEGDIEFLMLLEVCLKSEHRRLSRELIMHLQEKINVSRENEGLVLSICRLMKEHDQSLISAFSRMLGGYEQTFEKLEIHPGRNQNLADEDCARIEEQSFFANSLPYPPLVLEALDRIDRMSVSWSGYAEVKNYANSLFEAGSIHEMQLIFGICQRDPLIAARCIEDNSGKNHEHLKNMILHFIDSSSRVKPSHILALLLLGDVALLEKKLIHLADDEGSGVPGLSGLYKEVLDNISTSDYLTLLDICLRSKHSHLFTKLTGFFSGKIDVSQNDLAISRKLFSSLKSHGNLHMFFQLAKKIGLRELHSIFSDSLDEKFWMMGGIKLFDLYMKMVLSVSSDLKVSYENLKETVAKNCTDDDFMETFLYYISIRKLIDFGDIDFKIDVRNIRHFNEDFTNEEYERIYFDTLYSCLTHQVKVSHFIYLAVPLASRVRTSKQFENDVTDSTIAALDCLKAAFGNGYSLVEISKLFFESRVSRFVFLDDFLSLAKQYFPNDNDHLNEVIGRRYVSGYVKSIWNRKVVVSRINLKIRHILSISTLDANAFPIKSIVFFRLQYNYETEKISGYELKRNEETDKDEWKMLETFYLDVIETKCVAPFVAVGLKKLRSIDFVKGNKLDEYLALLTNAMVALNDDLPALIEFLMALGKNNLFLESSSIYNPTLSPTYFMPAKLRHLCASALLDSMRQGKDLDLILKIYMNSPLKKVFSLETLLEQISNNYEGVDLPKAFSNIVFFGKLCNLSDKGAYFKIKSVYALNPAVLASKTVNISELQDSNLIPLQLHCYNREKMEIVLSLFEGCYPEEFIRGMGHLSIDDYRHKRFWDAFSKTRKLTEEEFRSKHYFHLYQKSFMIRQDDCEKLIEFLKVLGNNNRFKFESRKPAEFRFDRGEWLNWSDIFKKLAISAENSSDLIYIFLNSHLKFFVDFDELMLEISKKENSREKIHLDELFKDCDFQCSISDEKRRGSCQLVQKHQRAGCERFEVYLDECPDVKDVCFIRLKEYNAVSGRITGVIIY